jgi:lysine biosynthesis protein LysW
MIGNIMQTICLTCDATVGLSEDTEVSEIVSCPECQTRLVVEAVGENPQIGIAPAIEEDWGE